MAGLSRPMNLHVKDICKSIKLNIIGTANVVNVCNEFNIKLIYFSTGYVYEGKKGNYSEKDPVLPINNYAWSKLGGECAVPGVIALIGAFNNKNYLDRLELNSNSKVLLFGCEGLTDKIMYKKLLDDGLKKI